MADPILPEMAANFQDSMWSKIDELVKSQKNCEWPQILQQHSLLASAVFRLSNQREFLEQLVACGVLIELVNYSDWFNAIKACQNFWIDVLGDGDAQEMARVYIQERIQTILQVAPSLTMMMAWIQYQIWGDLSESVLEVALAKSKNTFSLVEQLWHGEDSLSQRQLFRNHSSNERWPTSKLFVKAFNAFYKMSPKNIQSILDQSINDPYQIIFWSLVYDHKCAVVNLPVLCGFWSMSPVSMAWWSKHPERQGFIQQLLKFDDVWFQVAYNQGCKIALALDAHHEFHRE